MGTSAQEKQANRRRFRLIRVERTPDEAMEIELKRRFYGLRIGKGQQRPTRFHKIVKDPPELLPLATISKLTDDAVAAGCSEMEFVQAIYGPMRDMIRAKFRKQRRIPHTSDTGEWGAVG